MALKEEMVGQGNWLFRNRSWIPLVALAALLAGLPFSARPVDGTAWLAWEAFCVALSLSGLAVRALAIGTKPRGTSGRNRRVQNAQALNTTGIYSVVRHPLYLGNALMWAGITVYPRQWTAAVFVAAFFWIFYERVMLAEEEFLRGRFGAEYERWAERTPAFLPAVGRWTAPALPFSLRAVLKAEYPGFLAVAVLFCILRAGLDLVHLHTVLIRPFWLAFLGIGVAAYLLLRTLRKHTRVLATEGR
jgi:protein-S-isoprenylcysteine O-methyltransferase Ste14